MTNSSKLKTEKRALEKEIKKLKSDLSKSKLAEKGFKQKVSDLKSEITEKGKEKEALQQQLDECIRLFGVVSLENARLMKKTL